MPAHASTSRPRPAAHLQGRAKWHTAVVLCLLFCSLTSLAASAQQFQARLFGQPDGLGNLVITAITQDAQGFLWIATEDGLFRYDGSQFREYGRDDGFHEPVVFTLHLDHTGTLWAGTHSGLYWFNGSRFEQVLYQGKSLHIGQNSMLASTSTGELVAQTPTHLFSITRNGAQWVATLYPQSHPLAAALTGTNGLTIDRRNRLIIGCQQAICVLNDRGVQTLGPAQNVPPDYYVAFFQAANGSLWARGRTHVLTWQPSAASVRDLSPLFPPGADRTVFRRFTQDTFGNILTPTASGFATWNGTAWTETQATSAGPINGATDVFADREGSIWLGTEGAGLLQSLGYGLWANFGTAQGLAGAHVSAIGRSVAVSSSHSGPGSVPASMPGASPGAIWIGNSLGVNLLPSGTARLTTSPLAHLANARSDTHNTIGFAPDASGGMWLATLLGHIYHVSAAGSIDRQAAIDGYLASILLTPDGTLWVAAGDALYRLQCTASPACTASPVFLSAGHPLPASSLALDASGGIWAAGEQGLAHLSLDGKAQLEVPAGSPALLLHLRLLAVAPDGSFWVSGQSPGIVHVRLTQGHVQMLGALHRPALASDETSFLGFDAAHRLWIGTDHGANVLENGNLLLLSSEDGLIWNDTGERAFFADPDGSVWIGTSQGLSHLLHAQAALHRSPFPLTVETVNYGSQRLAPSQQLPWRDAPVTVRFSALTFRDNASIVYHYRLQGLRNSSTTTTAQVAVFAGLPPGHYTFQVVAQDPHHGTYSSPVSFAFTIRPPWWRTWVFYCLAAVCASLSLAAIWRWSHLALLAQRRKLKRLVAERTRELEDLAIHDSLTGLLNRKAILDALAAEIELARQRNFAFCVALVDLDHFKQINDSYGHLAGDEVLRKSASRLANSVRSSDIVGRYGGEEFFVILRGTDAQFGLERCEHVRQSLCAEPVTFQSRSITITCSVGLVCTHPGGDSITDVIARADEAMYKAKSSGRNRVVSVPSFSE